MPMVNGAYVAPTWEDGTTPALMAAELQAMSDELAKGPGAKLYGLVNGSNSISAANLSGSDLVGLADSADGTAKRTTLQALGSYLYDFSGALQSAIGSYPGSGTSSKTLTFSFQPKIVILHAQKYVSQSGYYRSILCVRGASRDAWSRLPLVWGDKSLTINASEADYASTTYLYIALG